MGMGNACLHAIIWSSEKKWGNPYCSEGRVVGWGQIRCWGQLPWWRFNQTIFFSSLTIQILWHMWIVICFMLNLAQRKSLGIRAAGFCQLWFQGDEKKNLQIAMVFELVEGNTPKHMKFLAAWQYLVRQTQLTFVPTLSPHVWFTSQRSSSRAGQITHRLWALSTLLTGQFSDGTVFCCSYQANRGCTPEDTGQNLLLCLFMLVAFCKPNACVESKTQWKKWKWALYGQPLLPKDITYALTLQVRPLSQADSSLEEKVQRARCN